MKKEMVWWDQLTICRSFAPDSTKMTMPAPHQYFYGEISVVTVAVFF